MSLFSENSNQAHAHEEVTKAPYKAKMSVELISSAAAYAADKVYEKHKEVLGPADGYEDTSRLYKAFAGAFVDHIVKTKGLDDVDPRRIKHCASVQFNDALDRQMLLASD